ncbi:MAG: hypothetical protein MJ087_05690 [Lachnospiraceae bacterium]|nr:hypothetical protein [Lachnospiraceae bacterium]
MIHWDDLTLENSIKDYEFTKRVFSQMKQVVSREDFIDQEAEEIFAYLKDQMEMISFGDYLRRFLFHQLGEGIAFSDLETSDYVEIIFESFERNHAPFSFGQDVVNPKKHIRRWLSKDIVSRKTIFVLGFGLSMTEKEVSDFLTKVIKEEDFRRTDPFEAVCWYCFHNQLPYKSAMELLHYYETGSCPKKFVTNWNEVMDILSLHIQSKDALREYLMYLKYIYKKDEIISFAYVNFERLYRQCQELICDLYNKVEEQDETGKVYEPEDIREADIERVLCSGIPYTKKGNLEKISKSLLNKHISSHRMSRQRLNNLMHHKATLERFDLITLSFLVCSQIHDVDEEERLMIFLDQTNAMLVKCDMDELYPVNAYEAFVMMCLLSFDPLETYSAVWELSYSQEEL